MSKPGTAKAKTSAPTHDDVIEDAAGLHLPELKAHIPARRVVYMSGIHLAYKIHAGAEGARKTVPICCARSAHNV